MELERAYPILHIKRKKYIQRMIQQIENWIKFHQKRGTFQQPIQENQYQILAHTIWMIITFYMTKPIDHGKPEDSERVFKEMVWSLILPHFTELGRLEFDLLIERLLDSFSQDLTKNG